MWSGDLSAGVSCLSVSELSVSITAALPVNKPKTIAVVILARWPQVSHSAFSYSTYSRRHVIGYRRRSASLWLVRQVRLITTPQSAILRLRLWECSMATEPAAVSIGRRVFRYLSILCIWLNTYTCLRCFDAVGWAAGRASGL